MKLQPTGLIAAILIAASFSSLARAQAAPASAEPAWHDQGESDIGHAAESERDPARRLELLKKWEQLYPETAYKANRTFMTTQSLTTLITGAFGKPDGPALDAGCKAARQLLDGMGAFFDDSLRALPQVAQVSAPDWAKMRTAYAIQAHALLAYDAALKKDDATAEAEYKKVLAIDPTQAATSYQLGATIIHEIKVTSNFGRFPEALYDLARSLCVTGPNALPPAGRAAAEKALKANYTNYHGSLDGLDDLMKQVADSALPPDGFDILSVVQIAAIQQKEHDVWAQQHPELDFWETIRATVLAKGDAYFAGQLQGVAFPPAPGDTYKGAATFQGKVVSVQSPVQILINVDNAAGDAVLKFEENIKGDLPAGTAIQFKGVVDSYTKDPYVLTLLVQEPKTDIAGLPEGVSFVAEVKAKTPAKTRK